MTGRKQLKRFQGAAKTTEETVEYFKRRAHPLPDITVGPYVTIQNSETKQWDIYGRVVDVGPFRKYFIKLPSGRVLARNRRCLCRRVPLSIPSAVPSPTPPPTSPSESTE